MILGADDNSLHEIVREECRDLLAQITEKTARIMAKTKAIKELAAQADTARRQQTMPGVGPVTAFAVVAFAPDMTSFRRARDFAAWLRLVRRQFSSGKRAIGAGVQGRTGRYQTAFHCWSHVAIELAWAQTHRSEFLAWPNVGAQTADARGDCLGQQDGKADLGIVDEESGLPRSGAGWRMSGEPRRVS